MRLLLVNDDGFEAAGLTTLARSIGADHEVWIVAPESEKSGTSNAITLKDSIRVRAVGERTYSCRGTPADCVLVALLGLVPGPVDLVLSGINHGPNLGTDILYSGTGRRRPAGRPDGQARGGAVGRRLRPAVRLPVRGRFHAAEPRDVPGRSPTGITSSMSISRTPTAGVRCR